MAMAHDSTILGGLTESRRRVLAIVKARSAASISDVASALGVSHEAARKQILDLQRAGWISTTCALEEDESASAGRPPAQYCLTPSGENLFPKTYGSLTARL